MSNTKQNTILHPDGDTSIDLMPQTVPEQVEGLKDFLMQYITENFELNGVKGITVAGSQQGSGEYEGYTETMLILNTDNEDFPFSVYAKNGSSENVVDLSNFNSDKRIKLTTTLVDNNSYAFDFRNDGENKGIRLYDVKNNNDIILDSDRIHMAVRDSNNRCLFQLQPTNISIVTYENGDAHQSIKLYDNDIALKVDDVSFRISSSKNYIFEFILGTSKSFTFTTDGRLKINSKYVACYSYRKLFKGTVTVDDVAMEIAISFASSDSMPQVSKGDMLLNGVLIQTVGSEIKSIPIYDTDEYGQNITIHFLNERSATIDLTVLTPTFTSLV